MVAEGGRRVAGAGQGDHFLVDDKRYFCTDRAIRRGGGYSEVWVGGTPPLLVHAPYPPHPTALLAIYATMYASQYISRTGQFFVRRSSLLTQDTLWSPHHREEMSQLNNRVSSFLESVLERGDEHVFVVSHGVFMEAAIQQLSFGYPG